MYGKGNAGHHFHFSLQSKFLTIPGIAFSSALNTAYYIPRDDSLSSLFDQTLTAGDQSFNTALKSVLKHYKAHTPDCGTIKIARITATAGRHCHSGTYVGDHLPLAAPLPMASPCPTPPLCTPSLRRSSGSGKWPAPTSSPTPPTW